MSSKPSSSETVQADVEAGNKTGIYYITICNLPFGLSWQELKDWLRQVCTVDHIELFPTSTSGWIRLHGRDNFENAWRHINTADFKGRSIIASDKNRTESIKIKELVENSTRPKSEGSSSEPKVPYPQTKSPTHHKSQPVAAQYSAASYNQYYMQGYSQSNAGVSYSAGPVAMSTYNASPATGHHRPLVDPYATADPWTSYSAGAVHGLGYIGQRPANAGPPAGPPYEGARYAMPYHSRLGTASYSDAYTNTAESTSSKGYIPTEPRKILITSLPPRVTPDEAGAWIRRELGALADEIRHIEVPPNENKKGCRGHAYIIFKSTTAAKSGVEVLDQAEFQTRKISARFTIEGVSSEKGPKLASAGRKDTKQARDDGSKGPRTKHKESGPTSRHGHSKTKSEKKEGKPEKKGAKKETKKETKAPEKKENKVWPIVADGSGRRSDKKKP